MGTIKDPTVFVPPEIWEKILENVYKSGLKDTTDLSTSHLLSCSRVCVTFQNVLEPLKNNWLFQQVLPIISAYIAVDASLHSGTPPPMLQCRLVCKAWKQAVDHFLENHHHYDQAALEQGNGRRHLITTTLLAPSFPFGPHAPFRHLPISVFDSVEKHFAFMKDMKHSKHSPFPGNSILVENFANGKLFSLFGRFIKVLHLDLCETPCEKENGLSFSTFLEQVSFGLRCLPNLTRLSIRGFLTEPILKTVYSSFISELDEKDEWNYDLPSLDTIQFDDGAELHYNALPFSLQCAICHPYFSQLKRLKFCILESSFSQIDPSFIEREGLPNLEVFEVKVLYSCHLRDAFQLVSKSTKLRCITVHVIEVSWDYTPKSFIGCMLLNFIPQSARNIRIERRNKLEAEKLYKQVEPIKLEEILGLVRKDFSQSIRTLVIVAEDLPIQERSGGWVGEETSGKISPRELMFRKERRRECYSASEKDLAILEEFPHLEYLQIRGFLLPSLKILDSLSTSLKYVILGHVLDDDDDGQGILCAQGIYHLGFWERLTRLRWLRVTSNSGGETGMCRRENWEWAMKMKKEKEAEMKKPIKRKNKRKNKKHTN